MIAKLSSMIPRADDLLALEAEEVAGVLVVCLGDFGEQEINQYNFFLYLDRPPTYEFRQAEVARALMEAWNWLEREGLLIRDAHQASSPCFFLSRRAKRMRSRDDFAAYRRASLLPKGQLHPFIATKVYPAFLRGEYDTAVFQAFREVEVCVRNAGRFPAESIGTTLMRDAFRPADPKNPAGTAGPLTDRALPTAEQEGMAHLFSGAIGLYKNPQSHRNVPTEAIDAAEVIVFASHLLRMVDRLTP